MTTETFNDMDGRKCEITYDKEGREVKFQRGRYWQTTKYNKRSTVSTDSLGHKETHTFDDLLEAIADSFVKTLN